MHDDATRHDPEQLGETSRLTDTSRDRSANHVLGEDSRADSRLLDRHTVQEAADALGTTVDAIRGRIRRGTLDSMKVDGQVYVLLDATNREQHTDKSLPEDGEARQPTGDQSQLVEELRDQIDWLRREVERKDTIIMTMAQRIPELESAPEPRESPVSTSEGEVRGETTPEQEKRRSWLYRFFFGP